MNLVCVHAIPVVWAGKVECQISELGRVLIDLNVSTLRVMATKHIRSILRVKSPFKQPIDAGRALEGSFNVSGAGFLEKTG